MEDNAAVGIVGAIVVRLGGVVGETGRGIARVSFHLQKLQ